MGKEAEQTFFQRRHTDGQQAHEKMFNITNHQGNANQNHNEISLLPCQVGYYQKDKKTTRVAKDVEQKEPSYTVGGNVNWYSHYGEQDGESSKN